VPKINNSVYNEQISKKTIVFEKRGQYLCVIASSCGTCNDPQNLKEQERKLLDAGVILMPSNAQAARLAINIIKKISFCGNKM
jgi:hypothetical protein